LLRQPVIQTVAHAGERVLVAEAATILEARRTVREQRPDGRVLDIGIPDGRVDGAQAISKSGPKRKRLVLTSLHASPASVELTYRERQVLLRISRAHQQGDRPAVGSERAHHHARPSAALQENARAQTVLQAIQSAKRLRSCC
jgi:hypothetical protein